MPALSSPLLPPPAKKLLLDELCVSGASLSADCEAMGSSMSEFSSMSLRFMVI